jgi:leucine dehydrogenase
VGYYLAGLLVEAGAHVLGADVNADNLRRAVSDHSIEAVATEDILGAEVDVFAPCAMGAILNEKSIPGLRAGIVAGAANNQLASAVDGASLQDRGILYCPDFLINAGGIIDVHHQRVGSAEASKREHILRIEQTLSQVLVDADNSHRQTNTIAEELARNIIGQAAQSLAA